MAVTRCLAGARQQGSKAATRRNVCSHSILDNSLRLSYKISIMKGANKERWEELCEQAAVEQDPVKLLSLITEINKLLIEKEERLVKQRTVVKSES